jgi:hypothetical protein
MSMQFQPVVYIRKDQNYARFSKQFTSLVLVALKAQFGLFQIGENDDRKQMPLEYRVAPLQLCLCNR